MALERWKLALKRGDCFCVVVREGLVIYGVASEACDGEAVRAWTYSEATPSGEEDLISLEHIDLPLKEWQFGLAAEQGWPGGPNSFRQIACLGPPGVA